MAGEHDVAEVGLSSIETQVYEQIRDAVAQRTTPLLVVGPPGSGKTTVLNLLARHWSTQGGQSCFVRLARVAQPSDLVLALAEALGYDARPHGAGRSLVLSSSSGELGESIVDLVASVEPPPLILFDGLDETSDRPSILQVVRLLSQRTKAVVIVTRRSQGIESDDLGFHTFTMRLGDRDVERILLAHGVGPEVVQRVPHLYERIAGSPLAATLVADLLTAPSPAGRDYESTLSSDPRSDAGDRLAAVVGQIPDRDRRARALQTLTLLAIRGSMPSSALPLDGADLPAVLASGLVVQHGAELRLSHVALAQAVLELAGALPPSGTRLHDLQFGAEEAERDSMHARHFVDPPGIDELRAGRKTVVIGDRGSGKSALFAALVRGPLAPTTDLQIFALEDPAELMLKLEANGEQLTTAEQFRAAWLLAIACTLASHLAPTTARQRRMAARLRAAVPDGNHTPRLRDRIAAVWHRVRRATIKFQLGPIVLEPTKAGGSSASAGGAIDIQEFLRETAAAQRAAGTHLVVAVDRIDEVNKYDRALQEKLVQGLFLAESNLGQLPELRFLIFIRTDLFRIYDIQEKNKLISRLLQLRWERGDLLRLLVHRALSSPGLEGLEAAIQRRVDGHLEDVLLALFPAEVERLPFTEWLWQCLKNGNGDVSPRQLVLLLILTRDAPAMLSYPIDNLPVFREPVLRWAMTRLSELSYDEIINDFRIGRGFLRSCRAGKIEVFRLADVEHLFEATEGSIGLQVELLEQLGVLERILVRDEDGQQVPKFRIPPLFTRCWTAAAVA